MRGWTIDDSADTYGIRHWGRDFLRIDPNGHLVVTPYGTDGPWVDLEHLVDDVQRRGIGLPLLLRFTDLLKTRLDMIAHAFAAAMAEHGYEGQYRGVYPVKVNQQRQVVEEVVRFGRPYHFGLEAGSKPELLVVLAELDDPEALIICNGYKDIEYIETAMMAQRLGRQPIIVIEKMSEVQLAVEVARNTGIRPVLGVRAKLASRGAGRWEESTGDRAKFGLTVGEIVRALDELQAADMLDCLQLLHFHIGSQVSAIRSFKDALKEATRIFVELAKMGVPMRYFDVGGGLGVDYDGSRTNFSSSVNYTIEEYAGDVVWAIQQACDDAGVPHPTIVTETGRALVAHHAILVVDVLGIVERRVDSPPVEPLEDDPAVLHELYEIAQNVSRKNYQESWHDAVEAREQILHMFNLGLIDLRQRARGEHLFWQASSRIERSIRNLSYVPDDLEALPRSLADTYFCNFSVFQSAPDAWAVGQLFPVVPIHRLNERPTRRGVLADITCDSDGKIDHFIDLHDVKDYLELHPANGRPYHLGVFLVGAYQEILGDLHNLLGDTNAVQVELQGPDQYRLDSVVEGDRVTDVLNYVEYSRRELVRRVRAASERAVQCGTMSLEESARLLAAFQQGLEGYTYLE